MTPFANPPGNTLDDISGSGSQKNSKLKPISARTNPQSKGKTAARERGFKCKIRAAPGKIMQAFEHIRPAWIATRSG